MRFDQWIYENEVVGLKCSYLMQLGKAKHVAGLIVSTQVFKSQP
jgi:hypothetical protein